MPYTNELAPEMIKICENLCRSTAIIEVSYCPPKKGAWVFKEGKMDYIPSPPNLWRSLADAFPVLQLHRLESNRMIWVLDHGSIGLIRAADGGSCGILTDKETSNESLQSWLDQCGNVLENLT